LAGLVMTFENSQQTSHLMLSYMAGTRHSRNE
jgi:hypothetical protein